jgi:anti-anti-sigma factor
MELKHEFRGTYLYIVASGRLDASWADYVTDTLLNHVRNGQHKMLINASEMAFLSSAGIRSLLRVYKELMAVKGSFMIYAATEFVKQTLSTSGFQLWLVNALPPDFPETASAANDTQQERYLLKKEGALKLTVHAGWLPWQQVKGGDVQTFSFPEQVFALGIGSAAENDVIARQQFGEFLAVAGNVLFQTPMEESRPDYLISEKAYIPQMKCIQLLQGEGEMASLLRFAPTNEKPFYPVSELLKMILEESNQQAAAFVILGEIEGLVGAALIKSPGLLEKEEKLAFPEIKRWLNFSGERVYAHQQALLTGFVKKRDDKPHPLLPPLPSNPELAVHIHAAVFPYQPLQNGKIDLTATVQKFFGGPPPMAVMHLADDHRPAVGLGESALIRGAVWCAAIQNPEVLR